tara:strand:+ start:1553 stop:1771 length:219 start_codon:yes stop_codon:yes gene_type:complete
MAVLVVANAVEIAAVISSFLNMTNSFSHQMKLNPDYQSFLAKSCTYQASWRLFGIQCLKQALWRHNLFINFY